MGRRYDVRTFGAVGDGTTMCTAAVQKAFDTASSEGGGTVVVPEGTFLSGAVFLRRDTALEIERGGCLLGSSDPADYRFSETRFEGEDVPWLSALLNAENLSGVSIFGEGTLDGNGAPYWKSFWDGRQRAIDGNLPFSNRDVPRPRLLYVAHCTDVSLRGISLQNSGFWHIHLYDCRRVVCSDLTVRTPEEGSTARAPSTDGIDIDSCCDVTVRDSSFRTDDDCICLKSGKGPDAHLTNGPTENVTIDSCRFGFGHGVVTFGSEATAVRNVIVRNCTVTGENTAVRMKFRRDTRQVFENILFEGLRLTDSGRLFGIQPWVSRQDEILGDGVLPSFVRNLVVRDCRADNLRSPGIIAGDGASVHISNVLLERIAITGSSRSAALSRFDAVEASGELPVLPKALLTDRTENFRMDCVTLDGAPLEIGKFCPE